MNYLDELAAAVRAEVDPGRIPKGDTTSLFRMYALLVRAKGTAVTARDVHDVWAVWALEAKPHHSAIRPWEDLDAETQAKDDHYVQALHRAATRPRST